MTGKWHPFPRLGNLRPGYSITSPKSGTPLLEHFHVMLSHGWIGKVVRALLGPGMRSRERGTDRLGSLSDVSEITENALAVLSPVVHLAQGSCQLFGDKEPSRQGARLWIPDLSNGVVGDARAC